MAGGRRFGGHLERVCRLARFSQRWRDRWDPTLISYWWCCASPSGRCLGQELADGGQLADTWQERGCPPKQTQRCDEISTRIPSLT